VDVATSDTGPELPVPVILDDHQATAPRALFGRGGVVHGESPLSLVVDEVGCAGCPPVRACSSLPPRLAAGFGPIRMARPSEEGFTPGLSAAASSRDWFPRSPDRGGLGRALTTPSQPRISS
jgi:hypothetical protein